MSYIALQQEIVHTYLNNFFLDSTKKKLLDAEVSEEPFPYLLIEDFLSGDFYQQALTLWPDYKHFKQKSNDRQFLWINYGCLNNSQLDPKQRFFWQAFGEIFFNRHIKPILIEKFMPFLRVKLQEFTEEEFENKKTFIDFWDHRQDALITYPSDRALEPHVDESNVFIQILCYFPEDNTHEELGTSLYYGPPATNLKEKIKQKTELTLGKKVAYKKGSLLAFLNTPISWHSVDGCHSSKEYLRKVFMGSISFSPECIQAIYQSKAPFSKFDLYLHEMILQEI